MTYERDEYMRRQEAEHDMIRMRTPPSPARCPRCNSPSPSRHPAVQAGGEVQICPAPFHSGGHSR